MVALNRVAAVTLVQGNWLLYYPSVAPEKEDEAGTQARLAPISGSPTSQRKSDFRILSANSSKDAGLTLCPKLIYTYVSCLKICVASSYFLGRSLLLGSIPGDQSNLNRDQSFCPEGGGKQ